MQSQSKDSGDRMPMIGMVNKAVEDDRRDYDKVRRSDGSYRQKAESPNDIMMTELAHDSRDRNRKSGVSKIRKKGGKRKMRRIKKDQYMKERADKRKGNLAGMKKELFREQIVGASRKDNSLGVQERKGNRMAHKGRNCGRGRSGSGRPRQNPQEERHNVRHGNRGRGRRTIQTVT